ncbi:MAG: cytochrome c [Bacteriovoracaceae bacterium]|nr:cytochrome c [Bacteriovoracaceae bacterium]
MQIKKLFFLKGTKLIPWFLILISCQKKEVQMTPTSDLYKRGKTVYLSYCISCHNIDPVKDGSLGPAVAGSSLELLSARVVNANYPAGYKPKRSTGLMVAFPELEKDIPAIHAFLNNLK